MASASPLLALHNILKLIEHSARTVSQYLQRWNSEGRTDIYAMIVMEIVGAVLLADSELYYLWKVCNTFPNQSHFRFWIKASLSFERLAWVLMAKIPYQTLSLLSTITTSKFPLQVLISSDLETNENNKYWRKMEILRKNALLLYVALHAGGICHARTIWYHGLGRDRSKL